MFLGMDQLQALFEHAARRGEKVEIEVQQAMADLRRRTTATAAGMRGAASTRTTAAVSSGVASLLNKLPGVHVAYSAPPATEVPIDDASQPAAGDGESNLG